MGQILIINNYAPYSKQEITNSIYYHWSAYTDASIYEVEDLRNKIKEYYDKHFNKNQNKLDFFNLACLNAISGIASTKKESIKYIEDITGKTYNSDNVQRNHGMIVFTSNDMDNYFHWANGTIDIYWTFNEDGTPDYDNTLFNLPDLVWSYTEDDLKEDVINKNLTKEDIELMKQYHEEIQITNIPITEANKNLTEQIPEMWYDKDLELFFKQIR